MKLPGLNFGPFAAARIGAPVVLTAQGHCDRRALLSDKAIRANLPQRFFPHSPSAKYPQPRSATLVYITNIPGPPRNYTFPENGTARLPQCPRHPLAIRPRQKMELLGCLDAFANPPEAKVM